MVKNYSNEYVKRVKERFNGLSEERKIEALLAANIYFKGLNLDNISFYTAKIALEAVGCDIEGR